MQHLAFVIFVLAGSAGCFSKPERLEGTGLVDGAVDGRLPGDGDDPDLTMCTPSRCPGGTCRPDGFCEIMGSNSTAPQQCPANIKCRVVCDGRCRGGVDCGDASECDVRCNGEDSCKDGTVDCGNAAVCRVDCEGDNACQGSQFPAVDCRDSQCVVECDGSAACQKGVRSTGGSCTAACCGDSGTCQDNDGSCTRTSACD